LDAVFKKSETIGKTETIGEKMRTEEEKTTNTLKKLGHVPRLRHSSLDEEGLPKRELMFCSRSARQMHGTSALCSVYDAPVINDH